MIVFGTRRYLYQLAMVVLVCGRCGNSAAHALRHRVVKFTLFFIPLFPVSSKYTTQCTSCGAVSNLTKDQATLLRTPAQPTPVPQP